MRNRAGAAGALLFAAALLTPGPAIAVSPSTGTQPLAPRTVTLISGDRVTVTGQRGAVIEAGEGRKGVTFTTDESGGRLRVVPSDAMPLLNAGRLDSRLFDVTTLLEYGYDDRRRDLPLVVTGAAQPRTLAGASNGTALTAVGGFAVREERARASRFWKDLTGGQEKAAAGGAGLLRDAGGKAKVWLDGLREVSLDTSVPQIGAPAAWARGFTGEGVKVAVLDTGVDATHPDLAGKVSGRKDFTDEPDERDLVGHGTHVASTIAGSGAASGGRYRGVAAGVTLLDGRVCASRFCSDSAILAGMQWAAEQGARVVNMSLGRPDTPEQDPLEQAVEALSDQYGTLFVTAAGNEGLERGVTSPATADAALAVGAVDKSDRLAAFSNTGPRPGDGGLKPDITAPGVDITAARGKDSPGTGSYVAKSGTSMATPHVTGTAALLAGQHPEWKGDRLKAALMASAEPQPEIGVFAQGAGRVNADRATAQAVTVQPPGLGFGVQAWPHDDDRPVVRKLVYRNDLTTPVTLTLQARAGAVFTVSPSTLTVPAGGQAEATVTADTRADVADGLVSGYVLATGPGGVSVSTPVGVEKEVESYDLTVRHTNRVGIATGDFEMSIKRLDAEQLPIVVFGGQSDFTTRLPKGKWQVDTVVLDDAGLTLLVQPELVLDRARTVEADARLGRALAVKPPRADAMPVSAQVVYQWQAADGPAARGWIGDGFDRHFTAQLGPARDYDGLLTEVAGEWTAGTDVYRAAWFQPGRMVTGFERSVDPKKMATVRMDYASHLPGAEAAVAGQAWPRNATIPSYLVATSFTTPSVRTVHLNTDGGVRWQNLLWEYGSDGRVNQFESGFTRYRAGQVATEWWNRGVFGPSLPSGDQRGDSVSRTGDVISADLWMFGDGRGSLGYSSRAGEHTALYRDGVLVGEAPSLTAGFSVPAGRAEYRLVAEAERGAPATLSTRVSAAWTFRSDTTDALARLPVSVVSFAPELDARNTAPAGRSFTVPVSVRPLPGSAAGRTRDLSVEVSYDDGATWAKAQVRHSEVVLRHPDGDGFVSLRAKSIDVSGNVVEQTVIRAYRIASATS
ncbi:S8 family serine peptidase [Nonomuraea spiralis]|uniref:S8 family serine peptidase n=1 Tax=Nonomuraea spiralis TaxID=46182 RepID=A0ABV5I652_9ACTN|nr:S8 family serine peptidase [Nonomuraea spiralis]